VDIVTIDFETYYDKDYSLSKITTEEYIRNQQFEIIGVGIKVNDDPVETFTGDFETTKQFVRSLDYSDKAILCHNTAFDGAILSWKIGIKPKLWLDTLSMARPAHKVTVGGSLAALVRYFHLGEKGTEVVQALGKHRYNFTPQELAAYMSYCANDVELTYALFKKLRKGFPVQEIMVIDQTIRMSTEPKIVLDKSLLKIHLKEVRERKQELIAALPFQGDEAAIKKLLMSSDKFAKLLALFDVAPPMKISPTTGNATYAFAKTDSGMQELLEHPDDRVQALVAARLGNRSTIEETRTERLIQTAERGPLPILLNYYGAHTGRFSGGDKLNLQNFPSRNDNTLRRTLRAPKGHVLIAVDSSQIEARMCAYIAQEERLLDSFRNGRDVYSEFATDAYGYQVTKAQKKERFVGKTCLGPSTQVLTQRGWVCILDVRTTDQLWDGVEWVNHQGVSFMGRKPTINLHGLELTTDHEILMAPTKWVPAQYALDHKDVFQSAVALASLSLLGTKNIYQKRIKKIGVGDPCAIVNDAEMLAHTTGIIYGLVGLLRATHVQNEKLLTNAGGNTSMSWKTIYTVLGYLIDYLAQYLDAITQITEYTNTTVDEASQCIKNGEKTELHSYSTYKYCPDGTNQLTKWIGSTTTRGTNRGTSGFAPVVQTFKTNAKSKTLRPVYDILNSGSRNRFTVLTNEGPLLVHNCILGLQYGVGGLKLQQTLKLGQGGMKVELEKNEAYDLVDLYRNKYVKIPVLWRKCEEALRNMVSHRGGQLHPNLLYYDEHGFEFPNGLRFQYPALGFDNDGFSYIADSRNYRKMVKNKFTNDEDITRVHLYGAKVVENLTQALARIVITEQMTRIGQQYPVAFQVHDEIITVVPEDEADHALAWMVKEMSVPPQWAPDLPVACEGGYGYNYGEIEK